MSSALYNKAFEVQLTHGFFAAANSAQVNDQLEIVPTVECADLMKKGRMRFVRTKKGFTLFYQAYKDASNNVLPLVKLDDGAQFVFKVKLDIATLSEFLNVSDLDVNSKTYSAEKLFMLNQEVLTGTTNPPQTLAFNTDLANSVRSSIFTYTFKTNDPMYTGPADVVVTFDDDPLDQLIIEDVPYNQDQQTYTTQIDLSSKRKGYYTLEAFKANTANLLNSNNFYVDGNLAVENVFGIIRVWYKDASLTKLYGTSAPNSNAKFYTFNYDFAARSVYWRYYIVAKNLPSNFFATYDLAVIDAKASPKIFYASNPGNFTQPNGQPDTLIKINGLDTVILTSTTKIPFTETALLDINLNKYLRSAGPYTKISDNLPNARVDGVDSDQYGAAQSIPTITKNIAEIFVII
jgi:hypothetical protein